MKDFLRSTLLQSLLWCLMEWFIQGGWLIAGASLVLYGTIVFTAEEC